MRGTFALIALCSLAACRAEPIGAPSNFSVQARHVPAAPQTVFINISNQSAEYLCVPSAEVRLGSGLINVLPESRSDVFENRPPPDLLGGVDVSEGVQVIPPNTKRDLFLDLSALEGRRPAPTGVRGKVHALSCSFVPPIIPSLCDRAKSGMRMSAMGGKRTLRSLLPL